MRKKTINSNSDSKDHPGCLCTGVTRRKGGFDTASKSSSCHDRSQARSSDSAGLGGNSELPWLRWKNRHNGGGGTPEPQPRIEWRLFLRGFNNLGWRKSRSPPSSDRSLGASTVSKPETLTRDDQKGNNTRRVCLSFVEGASVFLFSLGNGKPKEHHHSEGS